MVCDVGERSYLCAQFAKARYGAVVTRQRRFIVGEDVTEQFSGSRLNIVGVGTE